MPNLMTAMNPNRKEILEQLKQGNTDVLKGLPPALVMQLGIELQHELDYKEPSPIDSKEVNKFILSNMADSGVKERLTKEIEQKEKEHAEKVAIAKQITESMNI